LPTTAFQQKLVLTAVDKLVFGLLNVFAAVVLNRAFDHGVVTCTLSRRGATAPIRTREDLSALLRVRYLGIPLAGRIDGSGVASARAGGLVGLAGSVVVVAAGRRLAATEKSDAPAAAPVAAT
jgi:hypothetical protein